MNKRIAVSVCVLAFAGAVSGAAFAADCSRDPSACVQISGNHAQNGSSEQVMQSGQRVIPPGYRQAPKPVAPKRGVENDVRIGGNHGTQPAAGNRIRTNGQRPLITAQQLHQKPPAPTAIVNPLAAKHHAGAKADPFAACMQDVHKGLSVSGLKGLPLMKEKALTQREGKVKNRRDLKRCQRLLKDVQTFGKAASRRR
ncbi:MAG: hypothetical protein KGL53_06175 [Elusimicrobia bacterium]|nr:hypothetical protein [Elusimicrobiota bacterium]